MIGKKINQLATELAPLPTDLTIIGDPTTGVSKKITLEQISSLFGGSVSFYTNLASFPAVGNIDIIYCAKDTNKLYLWGGSSYVEVFPSQSLLNTYQLRSEKGNANGYASLDSLGKVPISQLPSSLMEYKGTWNAATNTPTLANGTGDTGDVYICNVAGTVNFGAGPLTFAVGDYVIYSGSIWQRSSGAVGTVTSVGITESGDALTITGSPITTSGTINIGFAGTGAQYIKGDGTLATFPSIISQATNLITEVYNNSGATLTKGTIVYINGGQGNLPTVAKALATGDSTSAQTFGVVQADITNMNNGYVVVAGRISDLDTQAYSNGTQLYLSPTTAGTWTSTKPYAPQHLVYVGIVVRAHPTQGVVEVKIQNGYEMDELHNVAAQNPDNNDILQYKTATSLWTKVAGTTSNIAEGSNLYYTDARSRAALSFTAGSGAYNSTTGVITIPTNTNQLTNGAAFITLTSLAAGAGISYNNTTGVIASTITQYTDAMARASISLTTTGTSGAATYNNVTGVLNVPQYAPDLSGYVPTSRTLTINGTAFDLSANRSWSVGTVTSVGLSSATSGVTIGSTPITTSGTITLAIATASGSQQGLLSSTDWTTFNNKQNALTNPVTGTGTTNYLPKFTGTSTIGNSQIFDNGTNVGIGTASVSGTYEKLAVAGGISIKDNTNAKLEIGRYNTTGAQNSYIKLGANSNSLRITNNTDVADILELTNSGNLMVGSTDAGNAGSINVSVGLAGTTSGGLQLWAATNQTHYIQFGDATTGASPYTGYVGYAHSTDSLIFGTATSTKMTLNASGRLLLGTTSDDGSNRLQVNGGIISSVASGSSALITLKSGSGESYITETDGNLNMVFVNKSTLNVGANVSDIRFCTNNNTTTPALILAVTGAATFSSSVTATGGLISNGGSIGYGGGELGFGVTTSGATSGIYTLATGSPVLYFDHRATDNTGFWVWRNGSGAGSERMRLTSSGNLSIGNTNDTYKLDVSGTGRFTGTLTVNHSTAGAYGAVIYNTSATGEGLTIRGGSTGSHNSLVVQNYNGSSTLLSIASTGAATFSSSVTATQFIANNRTVLQSGSVVDNSSNGNNIGIAFGSAGIISTDGAGNASQRNLGTSTFKWDSLYLSGSLNTGAPTNGTAQPWRLGDARSGSISTNSYIIVSVNGTTYSIPALNGLP